MSVVPDFAAVETPAAAAVAVADDGAAQPRVQFAAVTEMVAWASLACILTLGNRFASLLFKLPPPGSAAGNLLAVLYLAGLLLALIHTARAAVALPLRTSFLLIVGTILALPSLALVLATITKLDLPLLTLFYNILPMPLQAFVNNFLGPIGLCFLGAAIGRVIKHPNTLLASAGFAIFFDIIVVTMGTVAQLMKSGSNLIAAVSVGAGSQAPVGHGPSVKLPEPLSYVTIGPADVLFIALFLSAVTMMSLSRRATFAWMYLLLLGALVVVQTNFLPSWLPGIPALVPMGAAVLIANFRHGAFTEREKRDLLIGCAFAIFCAALMIFWARRNFVPPPPAPGFLMGRTNAANGPIFVFRLQRGGPAAKAGLRPGDEVLSINGTPINAITSEEFERQWAESNKPGAKGMTLRVRRRGVQDPLDLTLGGVAK
jgi:hypothetical protein